MCPIDTVDKITAAEFEQSYLKLQKPVVITDGISGWQALKKWSLEYLSTKLTKKERLFQK